MCVCHWSGWPRDRTPLVPLLVLNRSLGGGLGGAYGDTAKGCRATCMDHSCCRNEHNLCRTAGAEPRASRSAFAPRASTCCSPPDPPGVHVTTNRRQAHPQTPPVFTSPQTDARLTPRPPRCSRHHKPTPGSPPDPPGVHVTTNRRQGLGITRTAKRGPGLGVVACSSLCCPRSLPSLCHRPIHIWGEAMGAPPPAAAMPLRAVCAAQAPSLGGGEGSERRWRWCWCGRHAAWHGGSGDACAVVWAASRRWDGVTWHRMAPHGSEGGPRDHGGSGTPCSALRCGRAVLCCGGACAFIECRCTAVRRGFPAPSWDVLLLSSDVVSLQRDIISLLWDLAVVGGEGENRQTTPTTTSTTPNTPIIGRR